MKYDLLNKQFLDLFAGAGGLSEGFIQAGFTPIAHIEMDEAAAYTLKTRAAYHWLRKNNQESVYQDYLGQRITRSQLYSLVPEHVLNSVLNQEISSDTMPSIFKYIDSLLEDRHLDVIIGGPPCQAYSLVGRSRDKNNMIGDERNYLYVFYADFLKRYNPKYFIFENVLGLLSAKDKDKRHYFDMMKKLFIECGYYIQYQIVSSSDYGVPQRRKRVILVGSRLFDPYFFGRLRYWNPRITVKDVFCDLPKLHAGEGFIEPMSLSPYLGDYLYEANIRTGNNTTFHIARPHSLQDLEIYKRAVYLWNNKQIRLNYADLPDYLKTHKNERSFTDRFKVVADNLPVSHTIVAHIAKDGHHFIHPDIEQNRSLTPREAARLQTFPDDFFFESVSETPSRSSAFRQIGNAVPVLLANRIAEALLEVL